VVEPMLLGALVCASFGCAAIDVRL